MAPLNLLRLSARRVTHQTRPLYPSLTLQIRPLHQTSLRGLPRKGSQDKDSIDTEATEYTKSGTDDEAAHQDEAAFDPNKTSPENMKEKAGEGNEESGNPLEVSPANTDVSEGAGAEQPERGGGAEKSAGSGGGNGGRQSGHGSPSKGKKV